MSNAPGVVRAAQLALPETDMQIGSAGARNRLRDALRQTTRLNRKHMTDITYILTSIAFFALMAAFVWVCEKI